MHAPIDIPAAWRPGDVGTRWLRSLTEAEIEAVAAILPAVRGTPILDLTHRDVPLGAFAPVLADLTQELEHGIGFKTLRGLPAARFTPEENRLLFWAIGTHLG